MTKRPDRRNGEKLLAYYHRVNEWERLAKTEAVLESRAIDRATRKARFDNEKVVSSQLKRDRLSLHDHAQHNSVLHKILVRMQRENKPI